MRADEIGERIDAALRSYAEPPEMPESRMVLARVLERARAEKAPRWRWWVWVIPAAGCAVALLVALIWVLRVPRVPEIAWTPQAPGVASVAAPAEAQPSRPGLRSAAVRSAAARGKRETVRRPPRLAMFPMPSALSPEERQLLAFANQASPSAVRQVLEAQQHIDDPIQIAPLSIRPLDEGDTTDQPNRKDNP
jgi:hypothetical protein